MTTTDKQAAIADLRTALEAHAAECRKALADMRPRPEMPEDLCARLQAERANLSGANLARADLAGANLADAYLARANLADAYLAGADLAGANLADAYLARANLAGANLARANLSDANLADAYLAGADLAGANLARANLSGADLARANLARANLSGANLADAYLARANLADAYLAGADLARANLAGAKGIVDVISLTRIGSRQATLTATKAEDGAMRVMTGCFSGTLDEFETAVAKTHGNNAHGKACAAAVALIRLRFGMEEPK